MGKLACRRGLYSISFTQDFPTESGIKEVNIKLTRDEIIQALFALEKECARRGIAGEICIYGGAEKGTRS